LFDVGNCVEADGDNVIVVNDGSFIDGSLIAITLILVSVLMLLLYNPFILLLLLLLFDDGDA
jgi:hypothetical protein